jgi:tetratricopeptide (TPR) repeat protein
LAEFLIGGLGEVKEGERLAREVWQDRQRLLGDEDRDTLNSQELYCDALIDGGKSQEATPIVQKIFEIRERVLGPDDYDTICSLGSLGQALSVSGAYGKSRPFYEEALKRFERGGWVDQRESLMCSKELAFASLMQGDPAKADKLLNEVIPRAARILGTNAMLTLQFPRIRVRALAENGQLPEAEALALATLALRRNQTSDPRGNGYTLFYLGRVQVQQGTEDKLVEAEPHLQ